VIVVALLHLVGLLYSCFLLGATSFEFLSHWIAMLKEKAARDSKRLPRITILVACAAMAKSFFPQRHWTEFYGKKN
jgi:hypothetical protein